jgi:hypothetical protein
VGSQRLTAWAMARPFRFSSFISIFRILEVEVERVHSCFGFGRSGFKSRQETGYTGWLLFLWFSSILLGKYLYSTFNLATTFHVLYNSLLNSHLNLGRVWR